MGIKGLLQTLAPAVEKGFHIGNLETGTTVAIDGHGWLHRACYSCSLELALEMPTRQYIDFFLHRLRMLMHHGLRPLVVFDGNRPTMKVRWTAPSERVQLPPIQHSNGKAFSIQRNDHRCP